MKKKIEILAIMVKREQKIQNNVAIKNNQYHKVFCAYRTRDVRHVKRESYLYPNVLHIEWRYQIRSYNTHGNQTMPNGQGQCDMLFNHIITDFRKDLLFISYYIY